jgi:hypothetical protein
MSQPMWIPLEFVMALTRGAGHDRLVIDEKYLQPMALVHHRPDRWLAEIGFMAPAWGRPETSLLIPLHIAPRPLVRPSGCRG